jgi:hypothetical protein
MFSIAVRGTNLSLNSLLLSCCHSYLCTHSSTIDVSKLDDGSCDVEPVPGAAEPTSWIGRMTKKASKAALYGTSVDIHQTVEDDPMIAALHERAEKFDERAEHVFGYLQVRFALRVGCFSCWCIRVSLVLLG